MDKTCSKCGEVKPFNKFGKDKRNNDGHVGACLVCMREYRRVCRSKEIDPEYVIETLKRLKRYLKKKEATDIFLTDFSTRPIYLDDLKEDVGKLTDNTLRNFLYKEYVVKGLSLAQVGRNVGRTKNCIKDWLETLGIDRRPPGGDTTGYRVY